MKSIPSNGEYELEREYFRLTYSKSTQYGKRTLRKNMADEKDQLIEVGKTYVLNWNGKTRQLVRVVCIEGTATNVVPS
jgi:hypothetical protein